MKWLGQYVQSLTSRFRSDVYLESISTGTIASGAHLGLDSNNKIVKAVDGGGDLTSIVAGTGLSGTSLTGPIPTINIDAAQPTVTSLGTLTGLTGGTGDFIWNTNTLVVDTSESKVGIGTTSPASKLHVAGTVQVGVDDTGHDVKFYGATSGEYMLWDESEDALRLTDNTQLRLGTGNDLRFFHNGTNSYAVNYSGDFYISNNAADKDLIFQCDNGSGGEATYLTLDGGLGYMVAQKGIKNEDFLWLSDSKYLFVGSGYDLRIHHNGSDSYISQEGTGSLIIRTTTNDEDITFQCDDGSGGTAEYFRLDGGDANGTLTYTKWADNSIVALGAGKDLRMYHNGTNSIIQNYTGNLSIRNGADDGDIIFDCDDGSGGLTPYLTLDGSAGYTTVQKRMRFDDNKEVQLGAGGDLSLKHVSNQSYIDNSTGNLNIRQKANDGDIVFECDDGSGGDAEYLRLDGGTVTIEVAKEMNLAVPLATDQQKHVMHYQVQGYSAGSTNYVASKNIATNTAPFKHDVDIGSDGTTAKSVTVWMRTGGHVMPNACTLKRFTGWTESAGSASQTLALFRVRLADDSDTDPSAVLLQEVTYTASGNQIADYFNVTSASDGQSLDLAAGDIVFSALKGAGNPQYFNGTFEVEF